MTDRTDISAFARPLSKLKESNKFLDPNTIIEISKIFRTFTITLNSNYPGGTSITTINRRDGEFLNIRPPFPTRDHYNLIGWADSSKKYYSNGTVITSNLNLYAQWEKKKYVVTFIPNGGTFDSESGNTIERVYSALDKLSTGPSVIRSGYEFTGWFTATTGGTKRDKNFPVTANITLYAQWKREGRTVSFNSNGGTPCNDKIIPFDCDIFGEVPITDTVILTNNDTRSAELQALDLLPRKVENNDYKSYKTTLGVLDRHLIESYDLYNNLNNIFNPFEHLNETYFGHDPTTFAENPYVHKENNIPSKTETTIYNSIKTKNLVTKKSVDEYLKDVGICVPICSPKSSYYYFSSDHQNWINDNSKIPMVTDYQKDGIWTSNSKLKFHYGTNYYYYTDEVIAPKNIMLNVTGNIILYARYSEMWFENQHYFAGLTVGGKLITLTFLKNILKIKNPTKENSYYNIAQFHFNCPIADGTKFRIVTNANCKLTGISSKDVYSRKLYDSLNAVNLSYYDYGEALTS